MNSLTMDTVWNRLALFKKGFCPCGDTKQPKNAAYWHMRGNDAP